MAITVKSTAARNQIKQLVIENWRSMRDERSELEENWKRCLMAFLCIFDKKWAEYAKQSGRSRRYLGISKDAVDTLLPQIYDAVFGQDDWLKIMPVRPGFSDEDAIFAEHQKYLLLHQHRQTDFNKTMKLAIKSLLILGNCPVSAYWYRRRVVNYEQASEAMERWAEEFAAYHAEYRQIRSEYQQVALQMQAMGQEPPPPPEFKEPPRPPVEADIAFEGPRIQIGSIFNYVQEQHPNDEFEAIRIMRSWRTKAYIKEKAKEGPDGYRLYENVDAIENIDSEETAEDNEAESLFKMALGMEMPHNKEKVMIKELHGTFEVGTGPEKGIYRNYVAAVANDNTLIRCEPSPFYSGKAMIWNARIGMTEGAVYGIGPIEKGLDEQDSANAIHNQNIDAVNSIIQPEYEVNEDNLVDGVMRPSGPGARHMVTENGSIVPIAKNYQGVPIGFEAVAASIARHERITGAVNTASGVEETATRTARNSGIIATKLGGHVTDIEEELITRCLNMQIEMNAQYITEDQVISVTKDKRVTQIMITPEEVRRGYVAYAVGSKYLAEKQERVQNLMMAVQLAAQSPDGSPMPVHKEELFRMLFKEILGEADNIVMSREEYQMAMAEWQQAQQMMAAMQAQRGANGMEGSGQSAAGSQQEALGGQALGIVRPGA